MVALISRWKLKNGYPPALAERVAALVTAVRRDEPGTLVFAASLPAPPPPIGPPPDYAVHHELASAPAPATHLVFLEVYRDEEAFGAHLRGPFLAFMDEELDHFEAPWQGRARPEVTYLDARAVLARDT